MACLDPLETLLKTRHRELAAVILEPLVQAAAGMMVAPPGYLKRVRELCAQYNVLLIVDEVATSAKGMPPGRGADGAAAPLLQGRVFIVFLLMRDVSASCCPSGLVLPCAG